MKQGYYFKKIGNYNLIKEIGVGSFARVFSGRSELTNQDVAVKMIQKQNLRSENVGVIEKEIDILLKLDHPNIIKLLDFKRTVNNYYLIFEFCEHGDLDNYIRQNSDNKRLPEPEVKRISGQIAKAMEKLHSLRIVHRDLKLANILVNKDFQIKLADFGFAKYTEDDQFLISYCGTPLTMAPEVLKREKYNEKCDIWSVGIIIYMMLFGQAPFLPPKGGMINDLIRVIDTQELKFPEGTPVSDQVKQLLKSMLQRDWRERMSPVQFFKCQWLQTADNQIQKSQSYDPLYLQSILKKMNEQVSPKQQQPIVNFPTQHKTSDDIQEMDQNGEKEEDLLTISEQDQQLKYLANLISNDLKNFLNSYSNSIRDLEQLCKQIMSLNSALNGIPELRSLYLAVQLLRAARLEQGLEFWREQIVVLSNSSMHTDLVSLEVRAPLQSIYDAMSEQLMELKKEFLAGEKILNGFINSRLSIADNIYDRLLELFSALMQQDKLQQVDMVVIENVLELLTSLACNPPVEAMIQCRIQILSFSDMTKYWHIFKLVKCNQEKLLQYIEQGEQAQFDLGIKISTLAIPTDSDGKNVSFKEVDIIQFKNALLDQIKQQSVTIIG